MSVKEAAAVGGTECLEPGEQTLGHLFRRKDIKSTLGERARKSGVDGAGMDGNAYGMGAGAGQFDGSGANDLVESGL